MHNKCGHKLGVVAHEVSNKEKNAHLVPEKCGRKQETNFHSDFVLDLLVARVTGKKISLINKQWQDSLSNNKY